MRGFKFELLAGVAALAVAIVLPQVVGAAADDAPSPGRMHGRMLEKFDTDHDGKLSPEERKAAGEARFKTMDADGDGFVSHDEAQASAVKRATDRSERMFKAADADGDGKISRAEFDAAGEKMHKRAEAHHHRAGSSVDAPSDAPGSKAE